MSQISLSLFYGVKTYAVSPSLCFFINSALGKKSVNRFLTFA